MKREKFIAVILLFVLFCSLTGCGNTSEQSTSSAEEAVNVIESETKSNRSDSTDDIFIDLTALSSTMVYSEVYNMTIAPQEYLGKTVKMEGSFAVYEGESKNYYACIIADATACCSQGFEFVCADDLSYPEDYPKLESEITVQGIFDTYVEDGYTYCQLIDAEIIDVK